MVRRSHQSATLNHATGQLGRKKFLTEACRLEGDKYQAELVEFLFQISNAIASRSWSGVVDVRRMLFLSGCNHRGRRRSASGG